MRALILIGVIAIQIFLFGLGGCRLATSGELPGEYTVTMPWGGSRLLLRDNYTMEQEVHPKDGHLEKVSGTWLKNNGFVFIRPCLPVSRADRGLRTEICGFASETVGGRIELSIDSDYDLAYTKQ